MMMMMMRFAHNNAVAIHPSSSSCMITACPSISNSSSSPFFLSFNKNNKKKNKFGCFCVSSASPPQSVVSLDNNNTKKKKPSAGEVARTIMELSSVGTLSSSIINNNQEVELSCVGVRFAVDPENGSPIVSFNPNHFSSLSSVDNITSTLNVLLDQCGAGLRTTHGSLHTPTSPTHLNLDQCRAGLRTTQCTIHGSLHTPTSPTHLNKLQTLWEKRFCEKAESHFIHILNVQRVLQLDNFTQDGVWISSDDYTLANPDPLRDCARHLVHEINTHNREDVLRFCNVYVDSHVKVSDAKMMWVDRLGFDVHLYSPDNEVFEVRIPFPREVTNEKGAKSSFNGMSQQAWEVEKNSYPLEFQKATQLNKIASKVQ